jgi:uncharacterized protein YdcH (DUF465 family)
MLVLPLAIYSRRYKMALRPKKKNLERLKKMHEHLHGAIEKSEKERANEMEVQQLKKEKLRIKDQLKDD